MADQHWIRVVGFLQPPPAREVFYAPAYYRGGNGSSARVPQEISAGDRLVYLALGPFSLYAVGTVTSDPAPVPGDPQRRAADVKTDVFISTVMKTPHFGGITLPSGRDLRLLVEQYNYLWLTPEDGEFLAQRVQTKAGAKD